jgi:hypothetical protein
MAKPGDAGQRFLDLHRRAGRSDDVPVGAGCQISRARSFYRGGAEQLYDPTDLGTCQKISAKRRENKKSTRHTLELRRFGESAARAGFQAEPHLAGLSKRRPNGDYVSWPGLFAVSSEPVTPPFFYGWIIAAISMLAGFFSAGVSNITMAWGSERSSPGYPLT